MSGLTLFRAMTAGMLAGSLMLAGCNPSGSVRANDAQAMGNVGNIPDIVDTGNLEAPDMDVPAPEAAMGQGPACSPEDVRMFNESVMAIAQYALRYGMAGVGEAMRMAQEADTRLSQSCQIALKAAADEQHVPRVQQVPEWATRPWLPNECHAGTCAPPS